MLRKSADAYRKSGQAASARSTLERALKLLRDNYRQLDGKAYGDAVQQVTSDYNAIHA